MTEPHPGHENHICKMIEENGLTPKIKGLVGNPKFVCSCCGRAAANADNLCAPEPL